MIQTIYARLFKRNSDSLRQSLEDMVEEHHSLEMLSDSNDLSEEELLMLRNLLGYGKLQVDDVAIPRTDIIAFDRNEGFETLVKIFSTAGHSRIPVYSDSMDSIIGMVHIKDVFAVLAQDGNPSHVSNPPSVNSLLRSVLFVPQSMHVMDLLARMRNTRTHLAVVVDEYGGTDGLVTIENLVEAIVGDIEDEHDKADAVLFAEIGPTSYAVDARFPLTELEEKLGQQLVSDDERDEIDTIGGMLFKLSGSVPVIGDIIEHPKGCRFEVIDGDPRRIRRLRLHIPENMAPETDMKNEAGDTI